MWWGETCFFEISTLNILSSGLKPICPFDPKWPEIINGWSFHKHFSFNCEQIDTVFDSATFQTLTKGKVLTLQEIRGDQKLKDPFANMVQLLTQGSQWDPYEKCIYIFLFEKIWFTYVKDEYQTLRSRKPVLVTKILIQINKISIIISLYQYIINHQFLGLILNITDFNLLCFLFFQMKTQCSTKYYSRKWAENV